MFKAPLDLAKARILVTNDDGYYSTGIKTLTKVAQSLSRDVWVVAPETEQSAVSHSLTIRRPLRIREVARRRYAVDGTPTDCVLLAVNHILKDKRPTLCLSGINRGANLGEDVTYSGTIAAAMEATLLGVPAIALSQDFQAPGSVKWSTAEHHAARVIRRLVKVAWPRNVLINVNFPNRTPDAVAGVQVVTQGRHKIGDRLVENRDPRGVPYYWIGSMRTEDPSEKGSDIAAVKDGMISLTPLFLNLTHRPTMKKLAAQFR
ncbi:MAG: 5'/3'-nucleotidase SurE [Rhodospirillales bacterium]|nr:5'/3'-nucleotidase SurE [Rhodospirillales bacterium]